jgi:DNA topoisomerase IB
LNEENPTRQGVLRVIGQVAEQLGNTPAICRKCYIHPAVIDTYLAGALRLRRGTAGGGIARGLYAIEREVIGFLRELKPEPEPHSLRASLISSLKAVKAKAPQARI